MREKAFTVEVVVKATNGDKLAGDLSPHLFRPVNEHTVGYKSGDKSPAYEKKRRCNDDQITFTTSSMDEFVRGMFF